MRVVLIAILAAALTAASCSEEAPGATHDSTQPPDGQPPSANSTHDWTRFGCDAARTNVVHRSHRHRLRQRQHDAPATGAPRRNRGRVAYLPPRRASNGAAHDVFVVTTTYGKTIAIDANDGSVLWKFTPSGYNGFAGDSIRSRPRRPSLIRIANPCTRRHPTATSQIGARRRPSRLDDVDHKLPTREKIASALNFDRGHVIATTGGYIGDAPPYQGHVAIIEAASGQLLHVWNALCSDRPGLIDPSSCPESDAAIWGRAGAVVDPATGDLFVATGNGKWDGITNWGDAVIELDAERDAHRRQLHTL